LGSDTNRLIGRYLRENYRQAAFRTSAELAQDMGVSQASVSRFAATLGCSGYGDWVKQLQQVIRLELSAADRLWYAAHPSDEEDGPPRDRVLKGESENLLHLEEIVTSVAFEELARRLAQAREVIIISARAAATLAPYVYYFLSKVRPGVRVALPGEAVWDRLPTESPEQTALFALVFPRYPRVLLDHLKILHERGFAITGLTDRPHSPLSAYAELALSVPVTSASLFDSYAAPIVILNMLIRRIAKLTPEQSRARLDAIEELDQVNRVYL